MTAHSKTRAASASAATRPSAEAEPFLGHRPAALALLNGAHRLSRKAGQFLGQLAVDPSPMSEAQSAWLSKLLERNDLPPLMKTEL